MCPTKKTTRKQAWQDENTIAFSSLLLMAFCQGPGCVLEWRSRRGQTGETRQLLTCPPGSDKQEPSLAVNPRWTVGSCRSLVPSELLALFFYSLTPSHPQQYLSSVQGLPIVLGGLGRNAHILQLLLSLALPTDELHWRTSLGNKFLTVISKS